MPTSIVKTLSHEWQGSPSVKKAHRTQKRMEQKWNNHERRLIRWRTFLPSDASNRETSSGTFDDRRLASHGGIVAHRSHMRQPVNIEPSCVMRFSDAVHRRTPVLAAILHPHSAYVHVRYHIAVYRHVLAYHEPASRKRKQRPLWAAHACHPIIDSDFLPNAEDNIGILDGILFATHRASYCY